MRLSLPGLVLVFLLSSIVPSAASPGEPARPEAPAAAPAATRPAATLPATRPAAATSPQHTHGPGRATVHHDFKDVEHWQSMFDDPARAAWQKPEELVKALRLVPGDTVADLGAGTGYFERHLAGAVGEAGTVFAVDVEPSLVDHLRARAEREATASVIPVLASFDNPRLPSRSVDLVLIVDTFHHLDQRGSYLARLRRVLSERGRVAIVDFHKRPLPVGPPPEHKLDKREVIDEMLAAGFTLDEDLDDLLPHQYALVFRP